MRLSYALVAIAALFWAPAREASAEGRWLRAESTHFIVYGTGSERPLRSAVEELERYDATLRQLTQNSVVAAQNKLEIYILRGRDDLRQVWPDVPMTVAGVYYANPEQIAAFSINRDQGLGEQTILFHEYAHHFMNQYFADAYPAWFSEGFAEYVSTADVDERRSRLGNYVEGRTQVLFDAPWISMRELLNVGYDAPRRINISAFYAQSWLNAHYILSDPERRRAFSRYLTALKNGGDPVGAFEAAFGMSANDWEGRLRSYLRRGIIWQEFPPPTADLSMQITRMPEAADDLLLPLARAYRRIDDDEREDLAEVLIAAAARHPGDPMAQHARARAEIIRNAPAAARPILEEMLAANPQDVEAHYLMGLTYLRESEAGEREPAERFEIAARGRPHFVRAFRIAPNHVPTLYAYAQTFGMPMQDQTLEVLLQAQQLAPQVQEITFRTAVALMYSDAHEQAVPLLRAIAYNRHGGSLRRHALITLEAALARQPPPPPPPPDPEEEED